MSPEDYNEQVAKELRELQEYRKSLEEEFRGADPESEDTAKKARKKVIELVPSAGEALAYLLRHGESETVRFGVAKYIFECAQKSPAGADGNNTFEELLNQLKGKGSKSKS